MTEREDRLLELLILVGYSIVFPVNLAQRIGGHPDWNRHVMYGAIRNEYVVKYRAEENKHVIRYLRLTPKGFDYIATRDPRALGMIFSRMDSVPPIYPSELDRVQRMNAIAVGLIMSRNAGAIILPVLKPSLMCPLSGYPGEITPDPNTLYYYSPPELRTALEAADDQTVYKGSRNIGIIVRGHRCYFLYFTGRSRMYWMKDTEENYTGSVQTLLNSRGFHITTIEQIIIGSSMNVAAKVCRGPQGLKRDHYFVVSHDFNSCCYVTNNSDGDALLRLIVNPDLAMKLNRRVLAPYKPPEVNTREYDAVEASSNRPVILNYTCDLIQILFAGSAPIGFEGGSIMLCFDYQAQVIQRILGPSVEVRPITED